MENQRLPPVPLLTGNNYLVWAMKMEAILCLKRLSQALSEPKPAVTENEKVKTEWHTRNQEAVAYIRLHLSDEQALQFATESDAQALWAKIKRSYAGAAEDQKIDASNDLKFLRMEQNESVSNYIARARGLATKCISLGVAITPRELAYYTVRGINQEYREIKQILKTQREKSLEEINEILKEREKEIQRKSTKGVPVGAAAYVIQKNHTRNCYVCGKPGHQAKMCWHRRQDGTSNQYQHNKWRGRDVPSNTRIREFGKSKPASNIVENVENENKIYAFSIKNADNRGNIQNLRNYWLFDSGATNHMVNDLKWFNEINFQHGELHQAGENSILCYEGIGTVGIKVRHANKDVIIAIKDVLFVPKLRENLLSTTVLTSRGYTLVQGDLRGRRHSERKHPYTRITSFVLR